MSALHFRIEKPEDKIRRKRNYKIAGYSVLGLIIVILIWSLIWYIGLDRLPPEITLKIPEDGLVTSKTEISFEYDVKDDSPVKCETFLNGAVLEGKQGTLKPGKNLWKVKCVDEGHYKKATESKEREILLITPLKLSKISLVQAPELNEGIIQIYEGTSKDSLGKLLFEVLPKNAGLMSYNETKGSHLSVSMWGKSFIKQQKLKINNITVNLPKITNITGTFALYIDSQGNTYHSYSSHDYNNETNGNQKEINLNVDEALTLAHKAN
ncbi:hypothetical protein HY837_02075 [archaeon]|nr:hypothetical protein [archaeon]